MPTASMDPIEIVRQIPLTREGDRRSTIVGKPSSGSGSDAASRAVNIAIASLALVLLSPVMIVFAVLIKLTSPGPIVYSQPRVGIDRRRVQGHQNTYDRRARNLGGLPFMIYKFRTMYVGAERAGGAVWATRGDKRVTRIGAVMRKYRIDEIPQLFNVLRGDMNVVGPRPERPSIFSRLCVDIEDYPLRQRARPGITGWAQVNQSYDTNLDDVRRKVRYDLEYLERRSVREDLVIMARTVPVMIFRKGGW